ncbi:hypothetical protein FACS1894170_13710 [Planctomycetales bacterium]|nr:hypothetical protein FACS1894170_13710 [Planctomycetales bacterium]
MLFDNFQNVTDSAKQPETEKRGDWTIYNPDTLANGSVCKLSPNSKMLAGDENWTDYVLESVVMLTEEQGNAGLIFRVSQPGTGLDDFHGYYAGFDTKTVYLGKMVKGKWQQLAAYDLATLDCKVKANECPRVPLRLS